MADTYDPRLVLEGQGRSVVLVPGIDGTGLLFYRQVPLLARTTRVASYALRDAATTMEQLIVDLRGIVDAVAGHDGRAVIIGESFGGALAMSFALAAPDRVERLVILNSFAHLPAPIRLRAAIVALQLLPWGAMTIVRRVTAARIHSPHTHRDEVTRFLQLTARATRIGYLNRLKMLTTYDIRERLHDLRVPTLFLAADGDRLVPAIEQAQAMAARVPGAVVRVLAGHGHVCLIAPDVNLARILAEWA